jgi:hypothetical protein
MGNAFVTEITQVAQPQLEPLTLEEVSDWVHSSQADESNIRRMLTMCRSVLERRLGIAFYTQQVQTTWQFSIEDPGLIPIAWNYENMTCTLPRPPLQTLDEVSIESDIDVFTPITTETYDTIKQFPAQIYFYGDAFGQVEYPWWFNLNREPRVRALYTCGWDDVNQIPEEYKLLLLQFIADTFIQREGGGLSPELGSTILASKVLEL